MNISEEKEHLYQMMRQLLDERKLITDELLEIRKRINKLNDFQELGINDIPAIDYISLRKSLNDKKYEMVRDVTKDAHDAYKKTMEYATPNPSPKEYGESFQSEEEKNHIIIEESQKTEEQDAWKDISLEEAKEEKKPILRENSYRKIKPSHERIETIVINYLKEMGIPVDSKVLREHVETTTDYKFTGNNYSTTLWRIKKENDRVIQPHRGFYQYKF